MPRTSLASKAEAKQTQKPQPDPEASLVTVDDSAVPAFLKSNEIAPVESGVGSQTTYLTFFSDRSPSADAITAHLPRVENGNPVLVRPAPDAPVIVDPFRFALIDAHQCWVKKDGGGGILDYVAERPSQERQDKWSETIEAIGVVYLPDGTAEFSRFTFNTTKCPAARTAISAFRQATTEDWFGMSADHKLTSAIPYPWGRYYVEGAFQKKKGAYPYVLCSGKARPTTSSQWAAISELLKSPEATAELEEQHSAYQERVQFLRDQAA